MERSHAGNGRDRLLRKAFGKSLRRRGDRRRLWILPPPKALRKVTKAARGTDTRDQLKGVGGVGSGI